VLSELDGAVCLGVSVLTGAPILDAIRVSEAAKQARPDLPVVWGGWHASLFADQCLLEAPVNVAVQAQGEQTMAEVLDRLWQGENLNGVPGCSWIQDGHVHSGPPRPLEDINRFPAHDYGLMPVARYFALKRVRQLDYVASQGCRFRCAFCADPAVFRRAWFGLQPARIGDELEALWKRYRFSDVAFQDETFFTHQRRVVQIAEEFLRRGLGFTWTATLRADQGQRLPDDVFALCRLSGLRRVMVGVESADQGMLDWMNKDIRVEQVWDTAAKCLRHGIAALYNFIVGFPDESDESVSETLRMAKRLRAMSPLFEVAVFLYKPYPGNPIAKTVADMGYSLPGSLRGWAEFDYVAGSSAWMSRAKQQYVERFKFYQRFMWRRGDGVGRSLLGRAARWRVARDEYRWPVEKVIVERLRPTPRLS
jgi:radical SAM superfamily enzyme YgiQ (UPF0313 family)